MQNAARFALALCLAACCAVILSAPASAQTPAAGEFVFFDTPFPPYIEGREDGGPPTGGLAVRIVQEAFRRLDRPMRIELLPWRRVLMSLEEGRCDGVMLLMRNEERERFLCYTDPLCQGREMLYYRPSTMGGFAWEEFEDLKGLSIGLVAGFTYGEAFLAAVADLDLEVEYATDSESNMAKLYAGRVDLALEEQAVAVALLAAHPDWNEAVATAEKPVTVYEYHMAFSRAAGACDLVDRVNEVLEQMRSDGTLETILGYAQ